jgi:hypothetical protein
VDVFGADVFGADVFGADVFGADVFGADELRRRVLAAWAESPSRFRADANVEDDLALVGYRDRLIVELAQNAADAATRAKIAGRLELTLRDGTLTAANTGAPVDAAGVESIAVARASAKREVESIGRFGVGFSVVAAVSDEPVLVSRSGAVRWSRTEAGETAARVPALAAELAARAGHVPMLRLPFSAEATPPPGFDTVVLLPLRDATVEAEVRQQLDAIDETLLLMLPALHDVVIRVGDATRTLGRQVDGDSVLIDNTGVRSRWLLRTANGRLDASLLGERPAEERRRSSWQVTWAVPVDEAGWVTSLPLTAPLVRAPTPTDDPLSIPAVLIASYPLDPTRRHVTTGAIASAVSAHAADLLVDTIRDLADDPSVLQLVPVGLPAGTVDAELHQAVLDRLRTTAWLPSAVDQAVRLRPGEAVLVADPLVDALADVVPALLPRGWSAVVRAGLDVRRLTVADLVEAVVDVDREPSWWHRLYAALDDAVATGPEREALQALPVPLADGSRAIGPRGTVLPSTVLPSTVLPTTVVPSTVASNDATTAAGLDAIGVRAVHPDAAHPLLRSLGAGDGDARTVLQLPQVRAAVDDSYDADDPDPIAAAVLGLVSTARLAGGELPWLGELALPDTDGEWRPASELLLPGGAMATAVVSDAPFGVVASDLLDRWGPDVLRAVGVIDLPLLVREEDATGAEHDLDDEASWWSLVPTGAAVAELVAVRDLELVRDDAWPKLLPLLTAPPLRAAIVEPSVVRLPDGGSTTVPPYTAWWLSARAVLAGQAPRRLRLRGSDQLLASVYDVAPPAADEEFLRALGVLESLDDADADDVLDRLADPGREISRDDLRSLYQWLAEAGVQRPAGVHRPARVRALVDGQLTVVATDDAVVVDAPDLIGLLGRRAIVPVALAWADDLARTLDVPVASALAPYAVTSTGSRVDDAVVHDALRVSDADGIVRAVPWRLVGGELHVDAQALTYGLGRGRAWRSGRWTDRHRLTEEAAGVPPDDD